MMEESKIVEALKSTIIPDKRDEAEKYLKSLEKIIGYPPLLLQIVMKDDLEVPTRQAAVIYVKNMVMRSWSEPDKAQKLEGGDMTFVIHEQDRHVIRENIVEAISRAPQAVRQQLTVVVANILCHDFPGRWPNVVDKINMHLGQPDANAWMGGLLTLYKLVKNYEYKRNKEKVPLVDAMKVLLPVCYERLTQLMPNESQESVFLQKLVLKIFYALVQFSLNLSLMQKTEFAQWMELVRQILIRPVPEHTLQIDEEDRAELVWWKCKKWAIHLMSRIFERYGNPTQSATAYRDFAEFYLKNQSPLAVESVLAVLSNYRGGGYVSPRVLHLCLSYMQSGVSHAFSWKLIRPHVRVLIEEICFPLMCHNDMDQALLEDDPTEFIRVKYDIFDELLSPTAAAAALLSACMKRKDELRQCGEFVMRVLSGDANERQQDGALHMVGTIATNLLKSKKYKGQLQSLLQANVLPKFDSPQNFIRARACWVVQNFSEVSFTDEGLLQGIVEKLMHCLINDSDMPVKVESALALQMMLADQPKAGKMLESQIDVILREVLKLLCDTHLDDLTNVIQKLVSDYTEQVAHSAVDIARGLSRAFTSILSDEEGGEDRTITAMSILNTLETVLQLMEDKKEIMVHLEGIVLEIIEEVLKHSVMDFYEEVLSLVTSLTCSSISENMWKVYYVLYQMFQQDGFDYFTDFMPALHNYVIVDTAAFLSNPDRLNIVLMMCKQVLTNENSDEDSECHAAKLLEVVILQCPTAFEHILRPITEIIMARMTRTIHTSELRTMLLQVLIAGLVVDKMLMLSVLSSLQPADSNQSIVDHFINQWIDDTDCFLGVHDRKLCVLGLCALIEMADRPNSMNDLAPKLLPSCILLFQGLEKSYKAQSDLSKREEESDDSEYEEIDDGLASDEDEIDETTCSYLERISKDGDSGNDDGWSESDSEESDAFGETDLEAYVTSLDSHNNHMHEYVVFRNTIADIQSRDPIWYNLLVGGLNEDQKKHLTNIATIAEQKHAAKVSQAIEAEGGYKFNIQQVPTSFDFAGI